MAWRTTTDIREFLDAAGGFLRARPVDNTMLLTEAAYLEAFPDARDQLHGWWTGGGAFLQAPGHAPIVSLLPDEAWEPLAELLPGIPQLGVDARSVPRARSAWPGLTERLRIAVCRARPQKPVVGGRARTATTDDRDLLVSWYHELMAANPGDPSDLAYVVDFPLTYGGLTLWEVDGVPTAMAGRTPVIGGVTRVGASHGVHSEAAFAAACAEAATHADEVLVLTTDEDCEPLFERVRLGPWTNQ
ncbi:hypothetical protein [Paractinoplanes brasiliensis]|uniref:Uncharacterized protein n=1 Tax=Paractinoplanes brasiliensis TaxID=52695 RepID=A0A4R6JXM9_9ACTN|nr:hypothetical protein [Actinoplanes brasiliensis]TDO41479.1 hypothetical protein C8E87_5212 [Actinoplanes brasiliensis]GID27237.1 N-acetyltransferase [Actinoplanes brasiliensis]